MIKITFKGTGCIQQTKMRNHAGVLLTYKREQILFDCGEGIQRQMRIAGVKQAKITRLCISHFHGDHVFGVPGLLSSMGADEYSGTLQIYGPVGAKKYMDYCLKSFAAKEIIPFEVHEVKKGVFLETAEFTMESAPLVHSTPCVGFRFRENDKRKVNLVSVKKLRIEPGPLLGALQKGEKVVVNGKKILPDDVSSVVEGKSVSYVTDTTICPGVHALAKEVSLLIIEGTLLDNLKENAKAAKHLTVKQAAKIAFDNGSERLVITHISQRYKYNKEILQEAESEFKEAMVAEDFMKIKV